MIETGHRRLPIGTISGVSVNYRYRFRLVGRMTAYHVRRDKAALSRGCKAHPAIRSSRKRPWCVLSFEAVALLRNKGYRARRLEDGFPEWKMAGLPVS